jgi:hypothetical protein
MCLLPQGAEHVFTIELLLEDATGTLKVALFAKV